MLQVRTSITSVVRQWRKLLHVNQFGLLSPMVNYKSHGNVEYEVRTFHSSD
jgi:hypothetical protein